MRPDAGAHLWDAAEAARLVNEFAHSTTEDGFGSDLVIRSAIERQLEILGDALKRLRSGRGATFRDRAPHGRERLTLGPP